MIDLILDELLLTLKSKAPGIDFWIYSGGNSWADGWSGVWDVWNGTKYGENYVNLYRTPFEASGNAERPAIYFGSKNLDYNDEEEFEAVNSQYVEYRKLTVPLVIVAAGTDRKIAIAQKLQLRNNIRRLLAYKMKSNYWYQLTFPGGQNAPDRGTTSSSGGDETVNNAESIGVLSVCVHYVFNPKASNAA